MKLLVVTLLFVPVLASAQGKAPPASPELIAKGKATFSMFCASCHGEKGDGNGPVGVALQPKPRNFAVDPFKQGSSVEQIFATIGTGVPGTAMVPFPTIAEADRWAVAHYVKTMLPKGK